MLNRSSLYFRGGLMLVVVGVVFSLPNFLAVADVVPELGDAWRSPTGVALGAVAVLGGAAMVVYAFTLRRRERAAKRGAATQDPRARR